MISRSASRLDQLDNSARLDGYLVDANSQALKRILDRRCYSRSGWHRTALTDAFDAEWIER